ncbi:UNVERIFIED_CONTAM: hypothetical protein HDU68_008398, partial [Siphonaria sp. JEL0065]
MVETTAEAVRKLFQSHRTVRKYTTEQIPQHVLEEAIEDAIVGGASSNNLTSFSFVVTRDHGIKEKLRPLHNNQPQVTDASIVITVVADWFRTREWLKASNAADNYANFSSYNVALIDSIIVAQNLVLALESRGLGTCYLGSTLSSQEAISDILGLPETVVPVTTIAVGYPAEAPPQRDRLPIKAYIHNEQYRSYNEEEITELFEFKDKYSWERQLAIPAIRNEIEEAGVQNLAQFYTQLKNTEKRALARSRLIHDFIGYKGFG